MLLQLRKEIEAALAAAPTAELRAQLVNYDRRIQANLGGASHLRVAATPRR